jgi:hypothetical protein
LRVCIISFSRAHAHEFALARDTFKHSLISDSHACALSPPSLSPALTKELYPPCLIGDDGKGALLIRVPILKIFSVGCSKKAFYYLTSVRESSPDVTRFWLFAFQCKSRHNANVLSTSLIHACSIARELRKERMKKLGHIANSQKNNINSQNNSRLSVPGTPGKMTYNGGSWYEGSPHNSIVSSGSSSGASSMENSPAQSTPPSSSFRESANYNNGLDKQLEPGPGVQRLTFTPARRLLPLNLPGMPLNDSETDSYVEYKENKVLAECVVPSEMGNLDYIQLPTPNKKSPRLYHGRPNDVVRV